MFLVLFACLPEPQPADLTDPAVVEQFSAASASGVYGLVRAPLDIASEDFSCPSMTMTSEELILRGGCTRSDGVRFDGRVDMDGIDFDFDDFEISVQTDCGRVSYEWDGTAHSFSDDFDVDMDLDVTDYDEDCTERKRQARIEYEMTIVDDDDDLTVFDGDGTVRFVGVGQVRTRTNAEVVALYEPTCWEESLSGRTVFKAGGHAVVLHHDGEVDCDGTTPWTLDGEEMGNLTRLGW